MRKETAIMAKTTENNLTVLMKTLEDRLNETKPTQTNTRNTGKTTLGFSYDDPVNQYDIGRTRVTPFDPRSKSDSYYKFDDNTGKRLSNYRPVSMDIGDESWTLTYKPPQYGGKSEVKNFFDKSHLTVGSP